MAGDEACGRGAHKQAPSTWFMRQSRKSGCAASGGAPEVASTRRKSVANSADPACSSTRSIKEMPQEMPQALAHVQRSQERRPRQMGLLHEQEAPWCRPVGFQSYNKNCSPRFYGRRASGLPSSAARLLVVLLALATPFGGRAASTTTTTTALSYWDAQHALCKIPMDCKKFKAAGSPCLRWPYSQQYDRSLQIEMCASVVEANEGDFLYMPQTGVSTSRCIGDWKGHGLCFFFSHRTPAGSWFTNAGPPVRRLDDSQMILR